LLLNIFGDDTRMTCELHQMMYSWIGAAGDGGFIGHDHNAFTSAVLSQASGIYSLMVAESVTTTVAIKLVSGQTASISSDVEVPPTWGYDGRGAAFAVGAGAKLDVSHLNLGVLGISVDGGQLTIGDCILGEQVKLGMPGGGSLNVDSLAMPLAAWYYAQTHVEGDTGICSGAIGCAVTVSAVSIPEKSDWGELDGTLIFGGASGSPSEDPTGFLPAGSLLDPLCLTSHTTLNENWRTVDSLMSHHSDSSDCSGDDLDGFGAAGAAPKAFAIQVFGDPAGLAFSPPGDWMHCGTQYPGWLSA
jgi:hypothetical protein